MGRGAEATVPYGKLEPGLTKPSLLEFHAPNGEQHAPNGCTKAFKVVRALPEESPNQKQIVVPCVGPPQNVGNNSPILLLLLRKAEGPLHLTEIRLRRPIPMR
ncbi:hypothetical protein Salat_2642900 [Sesamum alatum]|uniref:Uncharacterized protein n=1 Tax=Sesamum alatum TaxID=300844 RepID=A0AAE2CB17_9LAMI|nr:hypothetical protein Salat_2642900 [Sesamum alatum]